MINKLTIIVPSTIIVYGTIPMGFRGSTNTITSDAHADTVAKKYLRSVNNNTAQNKQNNNNIIITSFLGF